MSRAILWIDYGHAHIFTLTSQGIEKSNLERKEVNHHTFNKHDHHGDPATEHFYRDVAAKLEKVEELLLLGPGLAKSHFKTYVEKHFPSGLAKRIVGVQTTDHPTDNQIIACAREFFKDYDLFHHPIQQARNY